MQRTVDGNTSLKDQENTLNFAERVAIVLLTSYVRGEPAPSPPAPTPGAPPATTVPHVNLATFKDRDITVVPTPLRLFEVTGGLTAEQIRQRESGTEIVFVADIWVLGIVKKVVGIR